jgi:hypothetical protein
MNEFLVLARCGMDDIPLRLCADAHEADDFVAKVDPAYVIRCAGRVYDLDASAVISIGVVKFIDGEPQTFQEVVSYE